ncbi:MAG: hypothetical protein H0V83_01785 [Rubrobacter sp.]|nr:hypothetical protein [Rubrobacter sp.]
MADGGKERKSFWARLFSSTGGDPREQRVLEYIVHRINEGANLHDVVEEEYVLRNASRTQREDIVSNPRIVEAARERMQEAFSSGELDPNRRPE